MQWSRWGMGAVLAATAVGLVGLGVVEIPGADDELSQPLGQNGSPATDPPEVGEPPGTSTAPEPVAATVPPARTVTFSPRAIPPSETEIANPYRGSYKWLDASPQPPGWPIVDSYNRFAWRQLEPEHGRYDFSLLDAELEAAKNRGGKFGLRVMPACTGCGHLSDSIPPYLHDLMPKGWWFSLNGTRNYAPDWNDPDYLDRLSHLLSALAARYGDDPRLGFVDVSSYGDYGEWHVFRWPYPAPTGATEIQKGVARAIVDLNIRYFPTKRLVMPHDHEETLAYAMARSVRIGVRNDCLGTEWFDEANRDLAPVIADRWKTAPLMTEFCYQEPKAGGFERGVRQVREFHVAAVGNGNMDPWERFSTSEQAWFMEANKRSGYRYELKQLILARELVAGRDFSLKSTWSNVGVTPAYTPWAVTWRLSDAVSSVPVWEGRSRLDLQGLLPTVNAKTRVDKPVVVNDSFTLPAAVPPGTYRLGVRIADPENYYAPMALATVGRAADGSYDLGTITVLG